MSARPTRRIKPKKRVKQIDWLGSKRDYGASMLMGKRGMDINGYSYNSGEKAVGGKPSTVKVSLDEIRALFNSGFIGALKSDLVKRIILVLIMNSKTPRSPYAVLSNKIIDYTIWIDPRIALVLKLINLVAYLVLNRKDKESPVPIPINFLRYMYFNRPLEGRWRITHESAKVFIDYITSLK